MSSQVKSSQVKSSQVKSSQVKSSQVKSSQVKSSQLKLNKILVGLALVLGFGVTNQSFAYEYFTSTNGCKVRQYSGEKLSKIDYTGSCQNGYANGQGNYTKYDSNNKITLTYKGQMKDGMPHGQGTIEWADGGKYDGEWKDGERHGLGKLTLVRGGDAISGWEEGSNGEWQGDVYVVQGEFINGGLDLKCKPTRQACDKARAEQEKQEQERREREYKASVEACKSRYVGERLRLKAPYTVSSFIFFSSTEYEYLPFKVVGVGKDKMTVEAVYDGGIIGDISSANIPCNATSVR